jgi:hypothetical protein
MQKVIKILNEVLRALVIIWLITVSVITIDQAAANALGWKAVFRIDVQRR